MRQLVLPMVTGMAATKRSLYELVVQFGFAALQELFCAEAEALVGPKHKRKPGRQFNHWGSAKTQLAFAGRKVTVERPRVRAVGGREVPLTLVEDLQNADPISERVVDQIILGVSTRGYADSLESLPPEIDNRGDSKSAASRHIVKQTTLAMTEYLSQKLDHLDVAVLMLDGIEVAKRAVIVALGIDAKGRKHPLGLWLGSTENKVVCIELLQNVLSRGFKVNGRLLCVIDGGKALRAAIDDVLGNSVVVQRCQLHKLRNVRDHLPQHRRAYVTRTMRQAYQSRSADTARKQLRALISWLENNGEDDAAASLREGLEETLTVYKLGLPYVLSRSLATTNAIENLMGEIRRITRNIKRWRNANGMVKRWVTLAISNAQRKFHKIKGYREMPVLLAKLRNEHTQTLDTAAMAA
jgi:transposase-like protein